MATTPGSSGQSSRKSTRGATDMAREKASEIGSDIREEAVHQAETAQHRTSESVRVFADAIRSAGDELARKDQGPAARILSEAAGALENLSTTLSHKHLEDIVGDVRRFGRNHPGTFIAGSVLVGMALGRFARSGAPEPERPASDPGGTGSTAPGAAGTSPAGSPTTASPTSPASATPGGGMSAGAAGASPSPGEAGAQRSARQMQGGKNES